MAFNNVPANGWPQIKDLEKLDALAKQIDNLPTFTSNDRAFLADLPAYPVTDGKKVLTATTDSGDTSLSYEEIESELPAEPSADGVKVLTATTESGETVLSWDDPAGGGLDYSTTEQNTGVKWIDGKNIYRIVVELGALPNATTKNVAHNITNINEWIKIIAVANNTNNTSGISIPLVYDGNNASNNTRLAVNDTNVVLETDTDRSSFNKCYAILFYTKTTT